MFPIGGLLQVSSGSFYHPFSGLRWLLPDLGPNVADPTGDSVLCDTYFSTHGSPISGPATSKYAITLRFRGVVETKNYTFGSGDGKFWISGGLDPVSIQNGYKITFTHSGQDQRYFINALWTGADATAYHRVFPLDYTKTVVLWGSSSILLEAATSAPAEIKNIDAPFANVTYPNGVPIVIPIIAPAPAAYDGQFVQVDVLSIVLLDGSRPLVSPKTTVAWRLNEAAPGPYVSDGINSLQLVPAPGTTVTSVPGVFGNAVDFTRTGNGGLTSGNTAIGETDGKTLTASVWVNPRSFHNQTVIFDKAYYGDGTWAAPYAAFAIELRSNNLNGEWGVYFTTGGTIVSYDVLPSQFWLPLNQWSYLAFTFDGVWLRLYFNGILAKQFPLTGFVDWGTHGPFMVGGNVNGSGNTDPYNRWDGQIDDPRVRNEVATADQLFQEWCLGRQHWADSQCLLAYKLEEVTGPYVNSGNAGALPMTVSTGGSVAQVDGVFGKALNIVAHKGISSGNTSVGEATGAYSISCWVYLRSYGVAYPYMFLKSYRNDGTFTAPYQSIALQLSNSGDGGWTPSVTVAGVNYAVDLTAASGFGLSLNDWQHVCLTWDGAGTIRVYRNGVLAGSRNIGGVDIDWGSHGPWQIGGPFETGLDNNIIDGLVDDCRTAGHQWSASEVNAQFLMGTTWGGGNDDHISVLPDSHTLLHYKLDEAGTPWKNSGQDGPLNLADSFATVVQAPGIFGSGALFSGHSIVSAYPAFVGEPRMNMTISLWVKITSYDNYGEFVGKRYRADGTWAFPFGTVMETDASGNGQWIGVLTVAGGGQLAVASDHKIKLGVWVNVAMTYDGTTLRLYYNGIPAGSAATTPGTLLDWGTHGPWQIGGNPVSGENFHGEVDDVRVEDITRSAAYLVALYQAGYSCNPPVVTAWDPSMLPRLMGWFSDAPSKDGLTWVDLSGKANNVTNTNPQGFHLEVSTQNGHAAYKTISSECWERAGVGTEFLLDPAGTSKISFAIACNMTTNGTNSFMDLVYFVPTVPGGNGTGFKVGSDGGSGGHAMRARTSGVQTGTAGDGYGPHVVIATLDWTTPSAAVMEFYLDNVLVGRAVGDVSAAFAGPITKGNFSIFGESVANRPGGYQDEVICVGDVFSSGDRASVTAYLQQKWNVPNLKGYSTVGHVSTAPVYRLGGNYTSGPRFSIPDTTTINGIRFFWPNTGSADTVRCSIWDRTLGTRLAFVDKLTTTAGGVFEVMLGSPLVLTDPTHDYIVTTYHPSHDVYDNGQTPPTLPFLCGAPPVTESHMYVYATGDTVPGTYDSSGAVAMVELIL
jgi:hypothetical protein